MKNILIISDGDISRHFIKWISKSRIHNNTYYINHNNSEFKSLGINFNIVEGDLTSYLRLNNLMKKIDFSTIFIIIENKENALFYIKNIRDINKKIRIIFVNNWNDLIIKYNYLKIININEIIANHLHQHLPNIPLIAQTIGLGQGDIIEVLVPFYSNYAYRHVGSISQRKWRISAIYRDKKQILPNNATIIYPNDTLILIGNPIILEQIYQIINQTIGLFPEPFGKHLYLIINMQENIIKNISYIKEAINLLEQIKDTSLYIRLINIGEIDLIKQIEQFQKENIYILLEFKYDKLFSIIDFDITNYNIGLFLISDKLWRKKVFQKKIYDLKRPLYIFGNSKLEKLKNIIISIDKKIKLESISSSVFALSEILKLKINLYEYNPDGNFKDSKYIIEHYDILANTLNVEINYEQKAINPIRMLLSKKEGLYIMPYDKKILEYSYLKILSTDINFFFMILKKHSRILIPIED